MRFLGVKRLSVLLVGTVLFCHGAFGALHLVCHSPECAGDAGHAAEHRHAQAGAAADAHEHPAGHEASTEYFAVVTGLIGLLLGLLPKDALPRIVVRVRRHRVLRRAAIVARPARPPTSPVLQVFRL